VSRICHPPPPPPHKIKEIIANIPDRRTTWDFQTVCFEMQEKDIVEVTSSCLDRKRRVEVVLPERKRRRRISLTQKEILDDRRGGSSW
jgi:hypothetical protein